MILGFVKNIKSFCLFGAILLCASFCSTHSSFFVASQNSHLANEWQQAQKIEAFIHKTVPGMQASYRDIFQMIIKEGYNVWLIGGAVRDILSDNEAAVNDLDFTFDCTLEVLEEILIKHNVAYVRLPNHHVLNIGSAEGVGMQGVESVHAIYAKEEEREFTINTIYYHVNTATFDQQFKGGLLDLAQKKLVVAAEDLSLWLYGGQSGSPKKIFRFWKMMSKGYVPSARLAHFMSVETAKAFDKDPAAFQKHAVKYLSGHFFAFDQVSKGCPLSMGTEWCQRNIDPLYDEALEMSKQDDALAESNRDEAVYFMME